MEVEMAQPVYKAFFVKFQEPWYQLSKAEQDELMKKVSAARDKVGGKLQLICNANWCTDAIQGFGVEMFPSIEAAQQHNKLLQELNWFRYIDGISALGTEMS